jgi:hypothetical protein
MIAKATAETNYLGPAGTILQSLAIAAVVFMEMGFGILCMRMTRDEGFSKSVAFLLGFALGPLGVLAIHMRNQHAKSKTDAANAQALAAFKNREIPDHAAGPFEQPQAPEVAGPEVIIRDKPPAPEELRNAPAFAPPPAPGSNPPAAAAQKLETANRDALFVPAHQFAFEEKRWAASPFKKEKA